MILCRVNFCRKNNVPINNLPQGWIRDTGNEVEVLVGRIASHIRGFSTFCHNGVVHNNRQIVGVAILKAEGLFPSFMLKRHCNCRWFPTGDKPREFVTVNLHQGTSMFFYFWNGPLGGRVKRYSVEGQKLDIQILPWCT